jgi:intracellular septation protein
MTQRTRDWIRYFVDFSAPVSFLLAYFLGGRDFMKATGVSIVVGLIALVVGLVVERRIAWLPLFVAVLGIVFGGLTLYFKQDWILKNRPTFVNLFLSALLLGGVALKRNPIKAVMGWALNLPDEAWRTLGLRYGVFCLGIGVANFVIWKTQTEATWVTWDTIGIRVLSALFGLAQAPLLMRYMKASEVPPPPPDVPTE